MQKIFGSIIDGVDYAAAAPTTGAHTRGEVVLNTGASFNTGWRCTVAGTPGTWEAFGYTYLYGEVVSAPATLNNGTSLTRTVTVTGAVLGDFVDCSSSDDIQGLAISAVVSAANTVKVTFNNNTGGAITLPSITLYCKVSRK